MGSGLCAGLWAELRRLWARGSGAPSPFFSSGPKLPSKTSRLPDCGLWALCETVGGVAQIVGSGLWRAKYFFLVARNCPSHASNLSNPSNPSTNCQWFCHTSGFWTLQTLQNLALARLWALGSVRDCGRSCADSRLGALAHQLLFF